MIDGRTYPLQFSYRLTGDPAGKYLPRSPGSTITMGWASNYELNDPPSGPASGVTSAI
ncbi:hypothetical protein [Paracoccus mutanolyticus]|uniref:hypothetical protein n=1 Tax=Paracoccus mutanolyticus TaxID=1499308 RepID=UPI001CB96009|nr:hypothetical protein [Paracoccus mutanolyticus]